MSNKIQIIQGGQWGSEAKGAVAAYFCERQPIDIAVRTGATNAGHTVYYKGRSFKMQQLPVGWVNPDCQLVIGAGAIVDLAILANEIGQVNTATGKDVRDRLWVDPRAYLHNPEHAIRSARSGRHHLMGATGKGCSEALVDRIADRGKRIHNIDSLGGAEFNVRDTEQMLNDAYDEGAQIQLEGTQGSLLDINLGPYPFTTHASTHPARWLVETGLSPTLPIDLVLVLRTYPIRVAGNSGPMPFEIGWIEFMRNINAKLRLYSLPARVNEASIDAYERALGEAVRRIGCPSWSNGVDIHTWSDKDRELFKVTLSEAPTSALKSLSDEIVADLTRVMEFTTVTRKVRRLAHMAQQQTIDVIRQTRPTRTVVTFMNYMFPQHWDSTNFKLHYHEHQYIRELEEMMKVPITHISRGPESKHIIETLEHA